MTNEEILTDPKTNRSRTEVGRIAFKSVRSHGLVHAVPGNPEYDVQFRSTDRTEDGLAPLLEPKINRSRAEVGRAIFNYVDRYGEVWVGAGQSDYDIQIFIDE